MSFEGIRLGTSRPPDNPELLSTWQTIVGVSRIHLWCSAKSAPGNGSQAPQGQQERPLEPWRQELDQIRSGPAPGSVALTSFRGISSPFPCPISLLWEGVRHSLDKQEKSFTVGFSKAPLHVPGKWPLTAKRMMEMGERSIEAAKRISSPLIRALPSEAALFIIVLLHFCNCLISLMVCVRVCVCLYIYMHSGIHTPLRFCNNVMNIR